MEEQNNKPDEEKKQPMPARSYFLMIMAGAYLIYTGYKLCKNVIDGVEGGSWGFFAAGAAFLIIGLVMMIVGLKNAYLRDREKKDLREAEEALKAEKEQKESKNMSIADRARLAENLGDAPEKEQESEDK